MADIVKLKNNTQESCYPITKARAIYNDDGTETIDKPLYSGSRQFDASETVGWKPVYVNITNQLDFGYYVIKITGALDPTASTILCLSSAATLNSADIKIPLLRNGALLPVNGEVVFVLTNANRNATNITCISFAQYTTNGGEVTVELFRLDQLRHRINDISYLLYKPIAVAARGSGTLDTIGNQAGWGEATLTPGSYIVKLSGMPDTSALTWIRLMTAATLNSADTVKIIYQGTVKNGDTFKFTVSEEEAAQTKYLLVNQYTQNIMYVKAEMFTPDQLYWRVNKIEEATDNLLPDYYEADNWLTNKIASINNTATAINGVVFPFITDLHFLANSLNSKYLLKRVLDNTACSMVVCGGDFAPAYGTTTALRSTYDTLLDYAGYIGHDKWFAIVGNHDFNITASSTDSTKTNYNWGQVYNAIEQPSERWQANAYTGAGYYCVDNEIQKTRFIMLNSTEPSETNKNGVADGATRIRTDQLSWLVNRINELSGYKIIVFSHIASDSSMPSYSSTLDPIQGILEAFRNKTTYSGAVTADFSSSTNELICHISGHSHSDDSHVSNNVLSISTTCDAHYQDDGHGATVGTVTEQAFDVFCIDYDARSITAIRIGRGNNRTWTY